MSPNRVRVCVALGALGSSSMAWADVKSLPSTKDNTLYEDAGGVLSNGKGTGIFAGRVSFIGQQEIRRGLLQFDLSAIPAGATITDAKLRLFCTKTTAGATSVALHRALSNWGEGTSVGEGNGGLSTPGDATWIHTFYSNQFWTKPGGDFAPSPSASAIVGLAGAVYEWSGPGLLADVTLWHQSPAQNVGLVIIGDESVSKTSKRFGSREDPLPAQRPELVVTFTPPPACEPDCDADGQLTVDDFVCFQTLYSISSPSADCDASGELDIDDFICFQTLFAIGC